MLTGLKGKKEVDRMTEIEELKTAFNTIYPNVPLPERKMPIAVVDGEPLSWKIVRIELNTKVGKEALKQMRKLKII